MDVIELIRNRIEDYNQQLGEYLLAGHAKTHEDYVLLVGKADAFYTILRDLEEIEQRYIED